MLLISPNLSAFRLVNKLLIISQDFGYQSNKKIWMLKSCEQFFISGESKCTVNFLFTQLTLLLL